MGWLADRNDQADALMTATMTPLVPPGESLLGAAFGNQSGGFSSKLYVLGVTEQHLIIQQVDRKWQAKDAAVVVTPAEVEVDNIFSEGAGLALGDKDTQLRFRTRGEKYKLNILGGNMLENALAGDGQLQGLGAVVDFLRRAKRT
jgi:hypothetical protein